jgi:hypothetical protein
MRIILKRNKEIRCEYVTYLELTLNSGRLHPLGIQQWKSEVPKMGTFLTGWATTSFSIRALLHSVGLSFNSAVALLCCRCGRRQLGAGEPEHKAGRPESLRQSTSLPSQDHHPAPGGGAHYSQEDPSFRATRFSNVRSYVTEPRLNHITPSSPSLLRKGIWRTLGATESQHPSWVPPSPPLRLLTHVMAQGCCATLPTALPDIQLSIPASHRDVQPSSVHSLNVPSVTSPEQSSPGTHTSLPPPGSATLAVRAPGLHQLPTAPHVHVIDFEGACLHSGLTSPPTTPSSIWSAQTVHALPTSRPLRSVSNILSRIIIFKHRIPVTVASASNPRRPVFTWECQQWQQ